MGTERQPDEGTRDEILAAVLASVLEYAYAWEYRPDGSSRPIAESRPWFEFLDVDDHPDPLSCWIASIHPDDRASSEDILSRQLAGIDGEATFRAIRRDGSTRWLLERWRCRPGRDGAVIVDGVVTDVSALRNTEVALAESRSLLAAVVSAVDAYVYCWDYDVDGRGTPVYESVPAHLFLRTRPSADPNEPWRTTLVPEDREGAREGVEQREAGQDGTMEWRCRGDDGDQTASPST